MAMSRDAWPSYAAIAAVGYVIYGVGAIAPYLRTQLALSDAQVGLHSTAVAIGLVIAGTFAAPLDRRLGEVRVRAAAMGALAVAVLVLAFAPALAATLAAAVLVGLGVGTILGYANALLARPGGRSARLRVARANLWAMVAAFACPIVLATLVAAGLPWGLGLAPAIALLVVVAVGLRDGPQLPSTSNATAASHRLPAGYWLAWAFLVAAIAVEFSIVFWGATLVARRTGVDTPTATLLGGLFLGGMFVGRLGQSLGLGTGGDLRRPAAIGVVLAGAGASLAWISTAPVPSGAGLFIAGLGVAGLYPLGVAAALAAAPGRPTLAGTRLTLASGTAILAAPLALGVVADATGVVTGWGLVVGLTLVALVLVALLPARRPFDGDAGPAEALAT
jgi:MFS family permease